MSEAARPKHAEVSQADLKRDGQAVMRLAQERGAVTVVNAAGRPSMVITFPDLTDPLDRVEHV